MSTRPVDLRLSAARAGAGTANWLEEENDSSMDDQPADEIDDLSSEQSEDGVEVHSGESSTGGNDDASNVETPRKSQNEYESRDGTVKWNKAPMSVSQGRKAAHNIVKVKRGLSIAKDTLKNPMDALQLFLDDAFFNLLMTHTNEQLGRVRDTQGGDNFYYNKDFDITEVKSAVGLLILSGVMCSKRESLEQLWSDKRGRAIFRATMSLKRFRVFLATARFDDKCTRVERRANDKLAPIREMMDSFVENCKTVYSPSPFVCVDESLLSFRGRCSFRVYMPSKPAKYELKVWCLCDVRTSFACNLQVYLGKATDGVTEKKQGARVVKDHVTFLFGSGRNVTTDNFFTGY